MVTSTNLSMLRNLEHFQVMSNILTYLKSENTEELKLASFVATFEAKLKEYDNVLVLDRGSLLSEKISEADTERDNALKAFISVVKAYTLFPDTNKAEAALKLQYTINKYGSGIDRLPYLQESGVLTNLLQDLKLKECDDAIKLLNLTDWVTTLEETTQRFNSLFQTREADNSSKLSNRVKGCRQAVQAEFEQLVLIINAYEVVHGTELYGSLATKINEAVEYARIQATRRGPRTKTEQEK